ncbi:MAG: DUF2798 domain-containing protein [Agriterribacter sp.]
MKKKIIFSAIMGAFTTGIISFILIVINMGFTSQFVSAWLRSWLVAYLVAVPAILLIAPKVQMLVDNIFKDIIADQE